MDCLSEETIVAFVGARLPPDGIARIEAHTRACSDCRDLLSLTLTGVSATRADATLLPSGSPSSFEGDTSDDARPRIFQRGQIIAGRYEIVRLLGAGGMGEVYEADDRDFGERIALKTACAAIARDRAGVIRFKAEAQLARKVTHRNVCRVFDLGTDAPAARDAGGALTPFLTMELIRGRALSDHIRAGDRFTDDEALTIARQIARGLQAAHEAGVLHRDLKTDNVLLAPTSSHGFRPVITDFGLAAATSVGSPGGVWSPGSLPPYGTRPYIAPERLAGAPDTPASDIYSLGVIMYELAAGALLARGPEPVTLEALPPAMPLATVIRRCMQPKPRQRPSSAAEVLEALEAPAPIVAAAAGVRARRRRVGWMLGGGAAVLTVALGGAAVALRGAAPPLVRPHDARPRAVEPIANASRLPIGEAPPPMSPGPALVHPERAPTAAKRRARRPPRDIFREVAAAHPVDAARLLAAAEEHLRGGRIEQACVEGRAAAQQAPAVPSTWEFLGRCYMRLGEPTEAREHYRRYLQLAPDGANVVFIRAIVNRTEP